MYKATHLLVTAGTIGLCVFCNNAFSAGFAIAEQSAAGTGNAYAGTSAAALDPSSVWYNPAAMTEFHNRVFAFAGHIVRADSRFEDKGSTTNPLLGATEISGSEHDAVVTKVFPNIYYIAPMSSDTALGFALNVPFGMETKYKKDWVGRYEALDSEVASVNLNASMAWRLNDQLSIGAGLNAQYFDVRLSNAIDSGAVCLSSALNNAAQAQCLAAGLTPANADHDSYVEVYGDNWVFTFNGGLLFRLGENTRFGLSFRAPVDHEVEGSGKFDVDPTLQAFLDAANSDVFSNTDASATAHLPATLSLSAFHQAGERFQILADLTWTQWSRFDELRVEFENPAQKDSVTTENWEDVMRYAAGLNYLHSDQWTFRTGIALDQEAIPETKYRTARIPGNDRLWVSFGAGYKLGENKSLDFGYAHLFVDETPMDHTDESFGHTTRGLYDSKVDIFSAQFNWQFD